MARKSEPAEMTKHTLNLYAGDYQKLQSMFPETGAAIIIRKIIRKHIERIEAATSPEDLTTFEQEFTTI